MESQKIPWFQSTKQMKSMNHCGRLPFTRRSTQYKKLPADPILSAAAATGYGRKMLQCAWILSLSDKEAKQKWGSIKNADHSRPYTVKHCKASSLSALKFRCKVFGRSLEIAEVAWFFSSAKMGKLPPLSSNTARKFPSDPWKMWQYRMTLWLVAPYMCTCIYNIVRYMNSNRYIYI